MGAVPPIVTILTILAFIIASAAVSWYITAVHTRASRKPLPHLEGGVYFDGSTLYFTVRNDGTVDMDTGSMQIVLPGIQKADVTCDVDVISPGSSAKCQASISGTVLDGAEGIVRTPYGDLRFTVELLKS